MVEMNTTFHAQRTALLEKMAALETMETGSLKSEFRDQPSGTKAGPYFKHQVWREGANVSQRISAEDAPALATAIANRRQFESLAATFLELTVAHTRQNKFPDSLKKKILPASSLRKKRSPR
jgi:mannitol-1-phosphate/altronate dehydrogenase